MYRSETAPSQLTGVIIMNLQNIMKQFSDSTKIGNINNPAIGNKLGQLGDMLPRRLAGGAMAGGLIALLLGNKPVRKFAGTAATYGGAALLGGLAYKAYKNWQHGRYDQSPIYENSFSSPEIMSPDYQLTLIKAMIAAARANGQIDEIEQQRIFDAIHKMDLSTELKALLFDLLSQPITVSELALGAITLEQKTELYLVSCLIIDPDHPAERAHLAELAEVLNLPAGLVEQLHMQAQQTMAAA
jgi:uncharacterized membrane protein YebE (DUF533 family)